MEFTSLLGLFSSLIMIQSLTSDIVSSKNTEWRNVTKIENERRNKNGMSIKVNVRQTIHDQYELYNEVNEPKNKTSLIEWLSLHSGPSPAGLTKRSNRRRSRVTRSLVTSQCAHGDLCSHSLCPWDVYEDEKSGRVPMVLKFAVCRSSQCNYDFAHLGNRAKNKLKLHSECSTLYEDFIVQEERGPKLMIDWPIACVCSKKRSSSTVSSRDPEYVSSATIDHEVQRQSFDDIQHDPLLGSSARATVDHDVQHEPFRQAGLQQESSSVHDVHTDVLENAVRRQRPNPESIARDYENHSADIIHAQQAMLRDLPVQYTRRQSYRLLRNYGNILPTQSWEERMEEIMNST